MRRTALILALSLLAAPAPASSTAALPCPVVAGWMSGLSVLFVPGDAPEVVEFEVGRRTYLATESTRIVIPGHPAATPTGLFGWMSDAPAGKRAWAAVTARGRKASRVAVEWRPEDGELCGD